ncbi:Mu-like prophage host-nuclease inhibitor protein Gam [Paenacidovorax caeni]|uniref:Mu-like prophage host-nuclease inhibitor protein Gam n=1 Tax=Paenacidovorax caeni TaxID=343013 RepID=A0A1I7F493_9BURK|nr:host-nuclease inhibitor Gam family protein [Paenacidovorax caeni]SFU30973.1 Mu-like prophage host-nuclease inhibitor protein Gam [Paenacidovorax caeni]
MATKKLKAKAHAYAPQSKADCQADIKKLGDLQRDLLRAQADLNDEIAHLTKAATPRLEALQERIGTLQAGVQTWCEANRAELCGNGKTANLITGEVQWRLRPQSISIRGAEAVIDTLKRLGLERFVRVKEEPNKEAMLNETDAVRGVAGITVVTGVEDFTITPFEVEVPGA